MKQDRFLRFEDRVQHLVEGGFARLFAGRLHPREVAIQLARAMEDHTQDGPEGQRIAPDVYVVRLNPEDHTAILIDQPEFESSLAKELVELARLSSLILGQTPEVRLLADEGIAPHQVMVSARAGPHRIETTEGQPVPEGAPGPDALPQASLLVNGSQTVPLDRPVLNIGRHRDNDIILDFSSISRHHAQIRLRFGRFVLFDLGSTGGTTVNGVSVREAILQSGDVLALAEVSLIYVEERPASGGIGSQGTEGGTTESVSSLPE